MTTIVERTTSYTWSGGRESCIRFGPDTGPLVIAALPLFEEANRTRAFAVTILRALAPRGIASILPDFPGTGESLVPTHDTTIAIMRQAYRDLVEGIPGHTCAISLRSGVLLDTHAPVACRWHLSPHTGEDVLRDLNRIRLASGGNHYAGNQLSDAMLADLSAARSAEDGIPLRIVRLDTDPRPADRTFAGAPLWRRAEPDNDIALAEGLAADIADWIASCAG